MADCATEFISCDWGTTHLRVRRVQAGDLQILQEVKTGDGAAVMHRNAGGRGEDLEEAYKNALCRILSDMDAGGTAGPAQVVVSGMATSTIGWQHVDYTALPTPLDGSALPLVKRLIEINDQRQAELHFVGGLRTGNDILRGEEIEAVGLFALAPELFVGPARLLLPGTHCKHMEIMDGAIVGFQTFMTGELFAHLAKMETLAPCLESAEFSGNAPAFLDGVRAGAEQGINALFQPRSRTVLKQIGGRDAYAFLSGLCIGTELGAVCDGTMGNLILAATPPLCELYAGALEMIGCTNVRRIESSLFGKAVPAGHRSLLSAQPGEL